MVENMIMLVKGLFRHPILARRVLDIKKDVYTKICKLSASAVTGDEPIKKEDLENHTEVPIDEGFEWAKNKFGACWFHLRGRIPDGVECAHPVVLMSVGGEGLAYDGEDTADIITPVLSVADVLQPPTAGKRTLEVVKNGEVDCYVDCGYNGFSGKFLNKAIFRYAYIAEKNDAVCDYYYDYVTLALLLVANENNLSDGLKSELIGILKRSHAAYAKGDLSSAKDILAEYYAKEQDYQSVCYTMIGQGHLDLAWRWPERESKRKAVRTFTNAVSMIEKEGSYVFGASQAQMYDWVKESHPQLFEKIKKYIADGNIEAQGCMWVECDCNMPSGESLIRQFLYGERFFKENFGVRSDIAWLPDAFGFPATFPQIVKGVGKKYFATIKLTWNKVNKFPYQSFYWRSPDGSRVLSHISPEGTYYNDGTPLAIAKSEKNNIQKDVGRALIIYGAGDGGGGAGEGHIEIAKRSKKLYGTARSEFGSADGFFKELEKVQGLPEYGEELYLEKHQGTLTAQSDNKKYNRYAERELHTYEWLSAISGQKADADNMWERLLFTQFHDVLPGSSIERVHRESVEDLKKIVETARCRSEKILSAMKKGEGISVVNPSPFFREEYISIGEKTYRFACEGYSSALPTEDTPFLAVTDTELENDTVRIKFGKDGRIISYALKESGTELNLCGLNRLRIYKDKKSRYDAWDMDPDYIKYPSELEFVSLKTYVKGAKAVAETHYRYGESSVKQRISIATGTTVRFDTEVDWHEAHKMLRADFRPTIYSDEAECDIQFGSVGRSTKNDKSTDRAKFEVCAHKYVSVGEKEGRFSLFSDSKYGYRIKEGVLSVNLLRSPKEPDENCDMGIRTFSYAMDFSRTAEEVVRKAYCFSYPVIPTDGIVDIKFPIKLDCDGGIITETIKPAETGEGTVLRMYERFGKETIAKLSAEDGKIFTANMLEEEEVPTDGVLTFRPYEIKTVIVRKN